MPRCKCKCECQEPTEGVLSCMSSEQANGEAQQGIADCELSIAEFTIYNLKSEIAGRSSGL